MSTSKSFSTETSERYARALFEVVKESSELDKAEEVLKVFLEIYDSSPEFINFLKNPTQSIENQLKAINIISKEQLFVLGIKLCSFISDLNNFLNIPDVIEFFIFTSHTSSNSSFNTIVSTLE